MMSQAKKNDPANKEGGGSKSGDGGSSEAAAAAGAQQDQQEEQTRTIDLDSLSLEELNQLRNQEEQRLQALTNKYGMLRQAAARLNHSKKAVSELKKSSSSSSEGEDREVMVPLTESVYVPGKMKDTNRLMLELGTGYFVERSNREALQFIERKQRIVDANSENIAAAVQASQQNMQALTSAMQGKMIEIRARQEGARHRQNVEK